MSQNEVPSNQLCFLLKWIIFKHFGGLELRHTRMMCKNSYYVFCFFLYRCQVQYLRGALLRIYNIDSSTQSHAIHYEYSRYILFTMILNKYTHIM